jgi:hypothetical protein
VSKQKKDEMKEIKDKVEIDSVDDDGGDDVVVVVVAMHISMNVQNEHKSSKRRWHFYACIHAVIKYLKLATDHVVYFDMLALRGGLS